MIENIIDIEECVNTLKILVGEENKKRVNMKVHQYLIEKVLHRLKQLAKSDKIFMLLAKQETGYGTTQARKLVELFTLCQEFPLLKYTSLSTETILKSYESLRPYIEEDRIFWNGTDIETLTLPNSP